MSVQVIDAKKGIRMDVPMTAIGATAATATTLYTLSSTTNTPTLVGTRSVKIKRIYVLDEGTGGTNVHIGTGTGVNFVEALRLPTVDGMPLNAGEDVIPEIELFSSITAYSDVGTVAVALEVEEIS